MRLLTERLYIRPWEKKDIDVMVEMLHDKSVYRFTRVPYPYNRKEAYKFLRRIKEEKSKSFGVFKKKDNILVGSCTLKEIDKTIKKAEVGYIIHRKHRNKGYATEIAKRLLDYGFKTLKLNRIEINHAKDNIGSEKVIKKLGAKKEGILRRGLFAGGKLHDQIINSILRKEYKEK
jgi:[ribosomal protein S5]-alanine N-acetyltransferase